MNTGQSLSARLLAATKFPVPVLPGRYIPASASAYGARRGRGAAADGRRRRARSGQERHAPVLAARSPWVGVGLALVRRPGCRSCGLLQASASIPAARRLAQPLRVGPGVLRAGFHATGQGLGKHERGVGRQCAAEQTHWPHGPNISPRHSCRSPCPAARRTSRASPRGHAAWHPFSALTPISWKPPRGCTTSATRPAWPRRACPPSTVPGTCTIPSTPTACCAGWSATTPAPSSKPANMDLPAS